MRYTAYMSEMQDTLCPVVVVRLESDAKMSMVVRSIDAWRKILGECEILSETDDRMVVRHLSGETHTWLFEPTIWVGPQLMQAELREGVTPADLRDIFVNR